MFGGFGGLLTLPRMQKVHSSAYRAFDTLTYPPLAMLGVDVDWSYRNLLQVTLGLGVLATFAWRCDVVMHGARAAQQGRCGKYAYSMHPVADALQVFIVRLCNIYACSHLLVALK